MPNTATRDLVRMENYQTGLNTGSFGLRAPEVAGVTTTLTHGRYQQVTFRQIASTIRRTHRLLNHIHNAV